MVLPSEQAFLNLYSNPPEISLRFYDIYIRQLLNMDITKPTLLNCYQNRSDLNSSKITQRPKMQDRPDALFFGQREFRCVRYPALLKTNGFGGCVVLFLSNQQRGLRGGAHFDGFCLVAPQVKPSFQQVITPRLRSICDDLSQFKARLVGGIPGERSENMTENILQELAALKIEVVELDYGRSYSQGAIIGEDNEIYELTHFQYRTEDPPHLRALEAYYASRNPLLRDASEL